MKTIQERYEEIKNDQDITDKIDKLIIDCYHYKIFREKASSKYKKSFKDDFEQDYPTYVTDITNKLADSLRARIRFYKDEEKFENIDRRQREKRGYSDTDVWNMNDWFIGTVTPMLKQFRKRHNGIPGLFLKSYTPTPEEREEANSRWEQILDRMIFLITEMDMDKCSMKNPYAKAYNSLHTRFRRKNGWFGEKLKTPEELKEEKEKGSSRIYSPTDFPEKYQTAREIEDKYFEYEHKITDYRNDCKNEFFELFSKYFWELWD